MIEIPCTIDTNLARSPLLLEYVDRLLRMRPRSIIYRCQIETWSLGLLRVPYPVQVACLATKKLGILRA
jgi:hypothetical protein